MLQHDSKHLGKLCSFIPSSADNEYQLAIRTTFIWSSDARSNVHISVIIDTEYL